MTADYEPKPGTVAFRALAHLETLPDGAEVMTSQLAEAIGAEASQIQPCLQLAFAAGKVFRRQRDDHVRSPLWWSLTDHSGNPKKKAAAAVPFEVPAAPAPAPAPAPKPAPRTVEEAWQQRGIAPAQPAPRIEAGPTTKDAHGFRACLWTNGVLQIERAPGDLVLIAPPHVDAIRRLLTGGAP
jgi:hypothetical protein